MTDNLRPVYPLRFDQDGQRLPSEVIGIIAKYLKDEHQDRTCANLNQTSRSVFAETLKTLWTVFPSPLAYEKWTEEDFDPKPWLRSIFRAEGAKHIQYVLVDLLLALTIDHFSHI
jgi:hypothetical protein